MALWSINERLAGRSGVDLDYPSLEYIDDLISIAEREYKERKKAMQEFS